MREKKKVMLADYGSAELWAPEDPRYSTLRAAIDRVLAMIRDESGLTPEEQLDVAMNAMLSFTRDIEFDGSEGMNPLEKAAGLLALTARGTRVTS